MGQPVSTVETKQDEIAKRYGGVLFDLAQKEKALKRISTEATLLLECLIDEPQAWAQVVNPTVSAQVQYKILKRLGSSLKWGPLMESFLRILCLNRRLYHLEAILNYYILCTQWDKGILDGVLETATKLPQKEITSLQGALKHKLGKDISLRQELKESLIGGVVLRIGSFMIDTSIKTQLTKLRQAMKG
jgi:F-type H+-transporting ATPase subunit delta